MTCKILTGCALQQLPTLGDQSVHCCVTSPPYWGLRDYGVDGQMGLEKSPDEYVATMVAVFREVRQVAISHGRSFVGIELNPAYVKLIEDRMANTQPGFM